MRKTKDSCVAWIGEIPEDWNIVQTKRFFQNNKKVVGSAADNYERLALTLNGVIKRNKDDSEGLQPEKFEGYQILCKNELVFKLIDLENVKTSRVGLSSYTGIVSPAYIVLSNGLNDNRYFYYWFMFMYYNEIFNHLGGDGVRSSLNVKDLLSLSVPSIDETEQYRIADYLDSKCSKIDDIIAKEQSLIEKLKEYKLSIITETVTKGLNPDVEMKDSGYEFIGKIPATWDVIQLRYIGRCQNGISKSAEYFGHGFPFVSYSDVYKNYELPKTGTGLIESSESEQENYSVKRGDIFFTRTSETIEEAGLTSVCTEDIKYATFAGFLIRVRPYNNDTIDPLYSKYYFRSEHHRSFIVKEMNLVTRASLGQELLKRLPVLLPPLSEQNIIANFLENKCEGIDSAISQKQSIIEKLTEYKKSLIYEVVTGKKEV